MTGSDKSQTVPTETHDSVDRILEQWRTQRPDLDSSPMGIVGRIQRLSRQLERALTKHFATHDLALWEFDVLGTLRRAGRLTAGQLVAETMVTSGAMTNRVDRLATRGLVQRETEPGNRRSVYISLTEDGRKLIDKLVEAHVRLETELLQALEPKERAQLAGLLRTLLASVE